MDPASASSVAARARTENFPVASLLFPRAVRPHLRAIYGFARLVDMLGDELEGDRVAALGQGDEPQLVAFSDDVCTGLQLVNFLQDVPRDLALGRVSLPAEDRRRFGVQRLDAPSRELVRLLAFEGERARELLL